MTQPTGKPIAIVIPFFFLHSAIFYSITYFFARSNPLAALNIGFFATALYSTFYYILFEKGYQSAFISATISIVTGLIFGDWILDAFYPDTLLTNNIHFAVMILLVHNVYLFLDLIRYLIKPNNPQIISSTAVRQKRVLLMLGASFGLWGLGVLIGLFDFEKKLTQYIAGPNKYHDRELGFTVSFPNIEMRKTWAEKMPDEKTTGVQIWFNWDVTGTRWIEAGYDPYVITAIPIGWWQTNQLQPDEYGQVELGPDNPLGAYLGQNDHYVFLGNAGVECPSSFNHLTGEFYDSKLCQLAQRPVEKVFKTFRILPE